MKEIKVSVNSWYVVEGTAGATVTNPSTNRVIATVEDGKQTSFYATTPYVLASDDSVSVYKATFNSAPAALMAFGLLGGGVNVDPALMKYAHCVTVDDIKAVNANYKTDLTEDNAWVYPVPNLEDSSSMFVSSPISKWLVPLPKLKNGNMMFWLCSELEVFTAALPNLEDGSNMFERSLLTEWKKDMPKLRYGLAMFSTCQRFKEFDAYCPELTSIDRMFTTESTSIGKVPITRFRSQSTKIGNGYGAFRCPYLESFEDELPNLYNGDKMFRETILNKESALRILNSIPKVSGSKPMTIGVHVDHQADEEVVAAIAEAEAKGWTLTVQWNGTPTAQNASTFALRKPPIYAKLGNIARPDGATEQFLDWGHYVTEAETNGYMEFANVEEANAYFGIQEEPLTEYNANE